MRFDISSTKKKRYKTYESQRNVTYHKNKKKYKEKKTSTQHWWWWPSNGWRDEASACTDEQVRQAYRWRKRAAIVVMRQRARHFSTTFQAETSSMGRKQCL